MATKSRARRGTGSVRAKARRSTPAKGAAAVRRSRGRSAAPPLPMPSALLDATPEPDLVEVPARTVLAIDGAGSPEGDAFGRSIGAIYGAAYGLKFTRRDRGDSFNIGPLEGRWWAEGVEEGVLQAPKEAWRWRLRIAVPDDVGEAELAEIVRAATSRKGAKLEGDEEARRVAIERLPRATLGRILHVGPYSEEPRSFARIDAAVAAAGRRPARPHVEIYLSDPRRTSPVKLRTVLLRELDP